MEQSSNIRFIEFYGLPGSGKTTLLKNFNYDRTYYVNGTHINKGSESINERKFARVIRARPVSLCLKAFRLQSKYNLNKQAKKFICSAQVLSINMSAWNSKKMEAVVLNDNGFIQILVSILKRQKISDIDHFINDYFNTFFSCELPYRFVYVKASPEICYNRILSRGKSLSITDDGVDTLKELYREKELFEFVTEQMMLYFKDNSVVSIESEENNS